MVKITSPAQTTYNGKFWWFRVTSFAVGATVQVDGGVVITVDANIGYACKKNRPWKQLILSGGVTVEIGDNPCEKWPGCVAPLFTNVTGGNSFVSGRRWGAYVPADWISANVLAIGLQTPVQVGNAASSPRSNWNFVSWSTNLALNSVAGLAGPYTAGRANANLKMSGMLLWDSQLTLKRVWVGMSSADISLQVPSIAPAASTFHFVGFVYDSSVSANWLFCTANGTVMSCLDTGVPVVSLKFYQYYIDFTNPSAAQLTIWQAALDTEDFSQILQVVKTTNLPASTTQNLGPHMTVTTLSGSNRFIYLSKLMWEQN